MSISLANFLSAPYVSPLKKLFVFPDPRHFTWSSALVLALAPVPYLYLLAFTPYLYLPALAYYSITSLGSELAYTDFVSSMVFVFMALAHDLY